MKWCTIVRVTGMRPSGEVTDLQILGVDGVADDHVFGLHQQSEIEISPVTGNLVTVYQPELHLETGNWGEALHKPVVVQ